MRSIHPWLAMATLTLVITTASPALGADASPSPDIAPSPTAPTSEAPTDSPAIPRCADVEPLPADPELYRDSPVYVANEMPTNAVLRWARQQPGFEELWIDREHNGWIHVAFSRDADAQQADIERLFPDDGVVAVGTDRTRRQLRRLQRQVSRVLPELSDSFAVSASVHRGVVDVEVGVLSDEIVAFMTERFGDRPICLDGRDPADLPDQGPQPTAGDGWRLLGAKRGAGRPYRTGIATDPETYQALWQRSGIAGDPPEVDFQTEVALWFGAVYGSSCPNLRLDDVVVDEASSIVHPQIVLPDAPLMCTSDANPYAFVVALDRSRLPAGPFMIQLDAQDPPPGAPRERTVVDIDLSQPGVVARPRDVHRDRSPRRDGVLQSGATVEPDTRNQYLFDVACGIEWLGEVNDVTWRADVSSLTAGAIPPEWQPAVQDDGTLQLRIRLRTDPEPAIDATRRGHTVTYRPSSQSHPSAVECPAPDPSPSAAVPTADGGSIG